MRKAASTLAFLIILSALVTAGDSAKSLFQKGKKAEARQDYEAAYDFYKAAYDQKPEDLRYRLPYERMRFQAAAVKVRRAQKLRDQGKLQEALTLFEQAAAIDSSNDLALQEIRRTQLMMQKENGAGKGTSQKKDEEDDPLRRRLEAAASPAELGPISNVPLSNLEIASEDTKVIYETIGKLAGINVLFDPDYTSRRLPIKLQKVSLLEALDILALESRTFWRPVTPNTIFVAQDTQAKRRELEQNVVKTFYLGNVSGPTDLQDIVNAVRTVLEVQRIQQIPSQSAIVIKGTPDQLALAEKMIDDIDKSKPEVIIDVVVAQVRRDKGRTLGIVPPQNATVTLQQPGASPSATPSTTPSSSGSLNFNDIQHLNSTSYAVTIDSLKAQALFNDDDTKILQNPRIRATDNEKATLKIADKIPIATGSFGSPLGVGTAVGAVGVNTQFSYTDVGVIMEITPRVHPDGQVSLKLSMEISNVSSQSTIGGITQPIISTRKAEQTIRLNDGEVSLLGGILEQQESRSRSGTPFLGSIPILRYLFSSEKIDHINNEIVFLLIPHVVRGQELNDLNRRTFDVGTGSGIDLRIASKPPRVESAPASAPAAATVATPPPVQPPVTAERPIVSPPVSQPQRAAPQLGPPVPATPAETSPPVPSTGGGQVSLKLAPESVAPQQGSTFALNIVLAHGQDIASVPIQISYDPKVVQFQSVSNGDYLARDGQQVALVFRDDAAAGKLQITAQRPPGSTGISGDGTVFSLVFMAKAKGTGAVAISIPGARNSQNQMVETLGSQAAVNVN